MYSPSLPLGIARAFLSATVWFPVSPASLQLSEPPRSRKREVVTDILTSCHEIKYLLRVTQFDEVRKPRFHMGWRERSQGVLRTPASVQGLA